MVLSDLKSIAEKNPSVFSFRSLFSREGKEMMMMPSSSSSSSSSSGSATVRVEKATSEFLIGPDWTLNIDICDAINSNNCTVKHGISLCTLIRKSADLPGPCLLIVGDMKGAVFGGLLECPLRPTAKRKYQGTNQTFVFTTIYGEPRLFRPINWFFLWLGCFKMMLILWCL